MHSSSNINVNQIDNLILITRGSTISAIAKLAREQTGVLMIIGQAMESSAGDLTMAVKIRSEFFYDPFVAGNRTYHANKFYELIKNLSQISYYLLKTGGIGEGSRYKEITLEHTLGIFDSLMHGGLDLKIGLIRQLVSKCQNPFKQLMTFIFIQSILYSSNDFEPFRTN